MQNLEISSDEIEMAIVHIVDYIFLQYSLNHYYVFSDIAEFNNPNFASYLIQKNPKLMSFSARDSLMVTYAAMLSSDEESTELEESQIIEFAELSYLAIWFNFNHDNDKLAEISASIKDKSNSKIVHHFGVPIVIENDVSYFCDESILIHFPNSTNDVLQLIYSFDKYLNPCDFSIATI